MNCAYAQKQVIILKPRAVVSDVKFGLRYASVGLCLIEYASTARLIFCQLTDKRFPTCIQNHSQASDFKIR